MMMTATVKRILLAEDDPKDVELALKALGKHNLANEVQVVRDGAEALDYLFRRGEYATRPSGPPAVVLLDIKMPKVDGIEVLRQIRADADLEYDARGNPDVLTRRSRHPGELSTGHQRLRRQAGRLWGLHGGSEGARLVLGDH